MIPICLKLKETNHSTRIKFQNILIKHWNVKDNQFIINFSAIGHCNTHATHVSLDDNAQEASSVGDICFHATSESEFFEPTFELRLQAEQDRKRVK